MNANKGREKMRAQTTLTPVKKMEKDILNTAKAFNETEIRVLVDRYYQTQENRKRSANQLRAAIEDGEECTALKYLLEQDKLIENQIKKFLTEFSNSHKVGRWCMANYGIGGVITAGLLAHIDIKKAPTAGHIWNYAGLNPDQVWKKGSKRPWNAQLKTLCWKIGESFVKVSNQDEAFYGQLYSQRKELEVNKNASGQYKDHAEKQLKEKNYNKSTVAYKHYIKGELPPGHVHAIAKRWTVKLFLSHLHYIWYQHEHSDTPPQPYALAQLGHAHLIEPPISLEDID
tara:strand:+ start:1225 stop:2082 length:858 start_codon:yes stop_codon:yes gene_type:complete